MTDTYYQLFDRDLDFEHGTGIVHTVNQATGALENLGRGGHEGPGTAGPSADQQAEITDAERAYKPFPFPETHENTIAWKREGGREAIQQRELRRRRIEMPGPGPHDYEGGWINAPGRGRSQVYWVRQLFEAIVSVKDHRDPRKQKLTGQSAAEPAQAVSMMIQKRQYNMLDVEDLCWNLFNDCQMEQWGVNLVPEHRGGRIEIHDTFEDRMHAIINACRDYKTVCKLLLEIPYSKRLAHAPIYETNRTGQTSNMTEKLDRLIAAAAEATKKTQAGPTVSSPSTIANTKESFTPSNAPSLPDETLFKHRICHILSVTEDFAHIFSLDQLRTYAFAYNRDLPDRHWTVAESATEYGDGITWLRRADNGIHSAHFTLALREYWDLAVARNDLTPNGEVTDVHRNGFTVQGVAAYQQALGAVENSCGLFQPLK